MNESRQCDDEKVFVSPTKTINNVKTQCKSKRTQYKVWTAKELEALKRSLGKFIKLGKIPQQHDCLLAMKNEPILVDRGWKNLKFQVANLIKKQFK